MAIPSVSKPRNFSLSGFIRITRLWNLLIIVLAQYFTAIFLVDPAVSFQAFIFDRRLFLLSFSSVLIAAAGYIINDYYDVKIDLINKPDRVIVGKVLKRRVAMAAHTIFNFLGIGIGFVLSWKLAVINFLSALLLWLYSNQLKRLPFVGNLTVALLTGLSIYIVDVLYRADNVMIIAYALFAFFFTLLREIIKDMEDLKGDATFGCRTLPVIYGIRRTKNVLYGLSLFFYTGFCVLAYSFVGMALTAFCASLFLPLALLINKLTMADTTKQFAQLSTLCKVVMLVGILSMVFFKFH